MGKKRTRSKYTSKGKVSPQSKATKRAIKAGGTPFIEQYRNKLKAWAKSKTVYMTIENPNKEETNKKFIRVPLEHLIGKFKRKIVMKKTHLGVEAA
jgi:hypothetical protein